MNFNVLEMKAVEVKNIIYYLEIWKQRKPE